MNTYKCWLRHPKTRAEKRANCRYHNPADRDDNTRPVLHRGRRSPHLLPDTYDDLFVCNHGKDWKRRRKTQYYEAGTKGKKFTYTFKSWRQLWKIERFLDRNNINYAIEDKREKRTYTRVIATTRAVWYKAPLIGYDGRQRGYTTFYKEVPLDQPITKTYTHYVAVEYRLTYWSKQEINLEKIAAAA